MSRGPSAIYQGGSIGALAAGDVFDFLKSISPGSLAARLNKKAPLRRMRLLWFRLY